MKGYSYTGSMENCASARIEDVNASYRDLSEVCGRIRGKKSDWAVSFLEQAADGEIPVLFKRHNKKLGHRRELGGRKGRYPWKAAKIVLGALQSAMANGKTKGLGDTYTIMAACANKKDIFPRAASKGRWARSNLETARVEIIVKGSEVPKAVTVTPPKKEEKKEEKKTEAKKEEKKPKAESKPEAKGEARKEEKKEEKKEEAKKEEKKEEPRQLLKEEGQAHEHKHEAEKMTEQEKKSPEKTPPHQHGEFQR